MKTNRLISRDDADVLDLEARIKLEAQITDAKLGTVKTKPIPTDWSFTKYAERRPWWKYLFGFLGPIQGKTILDAGCGYNLSPIYLARGGAAQVFAVEVSPNAVKYIRQLAADYGVDDRVTAEVCAIENLYLEDEQIDLAYGGAVLHHLELSVAGREISRVLKPGGRAGFHDPLGQNPFLEFARDYLPYPGKNKEKGTDHPLTFARCEEFGRQFSHYEYRAFGLAAMLAIPFHGRRGSGLARALDRVDGLVLNAVPQLHRFCRSVVTCVEK